MLARLLLAALLLLPALAAYSAPAPSPTTPITAIYQRIVGTYDAKRRNTDNGFFIWRDDKSRRQHFSARTAKLWRDADRLTPKGDQGPLGFDPVTNSQDPLVRAFDVAVEKDDGGTATVVVHIADAPGPIAVTPATTIRYDMVRENGRWLIDDIRGAIDSEWSVRQILGNYRG